MSRRRAPACGVTITGMTGDSWLSRRALLRGTLALGATAAVPGSLSRAVAAEFGGPPDPAEPQRHGSELSDLRESGPFPHGVASGDPLPTAVVLWTRVTPEPAASPGSGVGRPVRLGWEIATDPEFFGPVSRGEVTATADSDHTVHVDARGLQPAQVYYYRFRVLGGPFTGQTSRVGRTSTAPATDSHPDQLRLAVTSCANYESGHFAAYADIAAAARRGEVDVVVHMGDYLYEYASGDYAGKHGVVRSHVPAWQLRTLADYRSRHGHYRRDDQLQAAHAAAPWVVTWDDHEIANDAWAGGAENHGVSDGDWGTRRAAAMRAYLEWLPVRGTSPSRGGHIYRSLRFGRLAELQMLDLRSYRSAPGLHHPLARTNPERTIMGSEQFSWLSSRLSTAATTWNLIGTSVMISPLNLMYLEEAVKSPLRELLGPGAAGTPVNVDQWDGYAVDRRRLLEQLATEHPDGRTVFLTGDIHSEWATTVEHEGKVIAAELVCSSVTAPNIDDQLKLPEDNPLSQAAEVHVRHHNPHIHHVDLDAHGYSLLTLTEDAAEMSWRRVADIGQAGSAVLAGPRLHYDGARIRL